MGLKRIIFIVCMAALAVIVVLVALRSRAVEASAVPAGMTAAPYAVPGDTLPPDYLDRHPVTRLERQDAGTAQQQFYQQDSVYHQDRTQPQYVEGQPLPPQSSGAYYSEAPNSGLYRAPIQHQRVYRDRSTGKSLAIVGGSAAAGAAIGAVAGGGKGAGIGALVGGTSGFIYDRATHKKVEGR